jgi:hypothetical protein
MSSGSWVLGFRGLVAMILSVVQWSYTERYGSCVFDHFTITHIPINDLIQIGL